MAEQRNGVGLALRYSGAAEPEEPSAEVAARVTGELEAFIDHLRAHLEPAVFEQVVRLTAQRAVRDRENFAGSTQATQPVRFDGGKSTSLV